MKEKIVYTPCFIGLSWIVYAVVMTPMLMCENMWFYLIPHGVFFILFLLTILFCFVLHNQNQKAEIQSKEAELDQKIKWEEKQFDLYCRRKTFDDDKNAGREVFAQKMEVEKLMFDQLLKCAKELRSKDEDDMKIQMSNLQKEIEKLKVERDLLVEFGHKIINQTEENE